MDNNLPVLPVFLVGAERSGSTLLRLMLDAHPDIANPGEFDFLFDLVGDGGRFPDMEVYRHWLSTNRIFLAKKLSISPGLAYPDLLHHLLSSSNRRISS